MASSGIINGTLIKLKLAGSVVANLTSNDESLSTALRETTNKDSGGDASFLAGKRSAEYSAKLFMMEGATDGYSYLFGIWQGGTIVTAIMTSAITGDKQYTCSVLVKSLKRTNPMEANSEVDLSLQVTGAITESTI
jgi:Phage tail tube protein